MPEFLNRYPDITVEFTVRDRFVDPYAEGIDVLVRIGPLRESALIGRRLGESTLFACASPAYLAKRGTPKSPHDLERHACLGYMREGRPAPWVFVGPKPCEVEVHGPWHADDAEVLRSGALAGQGIVNLFGFLARDYLETGELVRVLADHPMGTWPIHALYPKHRHLLPKVGAFLDLLAEVFEPPRRSAARTALKSAANPRAPSARSR